MTFVVCEYILCINLFHILFLVCTVWLVQDCRPVCVDSTGLWPQFLSYMLDLFGDLELHFPVGYVDMQ